MELTKHLTTRTDDSHATPEQKNNNYLNLKIESKYYKLFYFCFPKLVRFYALCRIKPHAPPLVQTSVNFFEFQSCDRTTQAKCLPR